MRVCRRVRLYAAPALRPSLQSPSRLRRQLPLKGEPFGRRVPQPARGRRGGAVKAAGWGHPALRHRGKCIRIGLPQRLLQDWHDVKPPHACSGFGGRGAGEGRLCEKPLPGSRFLGYFFWRDKRSTPPEARTDRLRRQLSFALRATARVAPTGSYRSTDPFAMFNPTTPQSPFRRQLPLHRGALPRAAIGALGLSLRAFL